jgi:hypothetical protein
MAQDRIVIPNECEGSKKDFSLPLEMTRERYDYFHHRDKVSACTAMPQRHPCHAEQSEASRIFWLLQSRDSATVPQDDIATRCL